ncbi:unnamed protein product [Callosobruchus maculatus]|nr:unnamed protein product [Callosobruchus maculatus]
MEKLGR